MSRLHLTPAQRLPVMLGVAVLAVALIFAVAAFTGLGGRYALHPDSGEGSQVSGLDLSSASNPLETLDKYADVGNRPLFSLDRRPPPPPGGEPLPDPEQPQEPQPGAPLDVVVTSIIMTPTMRLAIITDNSTGKSQSIKVGQALDGESGWSLKELEPRRAVFAGPGGESSVDLRVFNGSGGQSPTPVAVTRASEQGGEHPEEHGISPPGQESSPVDQATARGMTPEERAEMIRQRIAERRRQMREEAARANNR